MDNQIWLVIWEWEAFRGASVPENIKAVKALTARGVLCSVCGSDEEAAAKRQLEDWGVWEDLAAPSVDLAPLSIIDRVNNIICAVRATPRSALYVDAGGSISWPENIRGARPSDLAALLEGPLLAGFPDPLHIRLAQAQWMDRLARRADWKERLLAAAKTSLLNADLPGVLAAQTARRKRDLDKCRAEMAALHCAGINLYQYFEERGVQTIDIAADQEMARLVMEDAPAAKIKIARLLTLGSPFILETDLGLNTYSFASLPDEHPDSHPDNCPDNPPDGECAAMAAYPPDSAEAEMIRQYISGRLFWLPDVIHALCTKHIFARKVKRIVRKRSHVPII
ncbi:MAG: hypothetical protein LBT44_10315, partial [Clostridiales bacterium]|nr:hypothetical protein [Clostridiales bacterium]